jgi:hypothetical protein
MRALCLRAWEQRVHTSKSWAAACSAKKAMITMRRVQRNARVVLAAWLAAAQLRRVLLPHALPASPLSILAPIARRDRGLTY